MCKSCWTVSGILLVAILVMSYKFILTGAVEPSTDGRQAIVLEEAERNIVLGEMRMFLASVQKISNGIAIEDMNIVVKAAREVGLAAQQEVPGALMKKLPLAFKKLGYDTHKKFDALAQDAKDLGDPQHALQQLSTLMNNCVACHSAYQIKVMISK
ncbi:MAG: hypothetical protein QM484_02005 [Woeseiaceae bacterium]